MAKQNPKIEDLNVRMQLTYDGRVLSEEDKERCDDLKSEFMQKLIEATDEMTKELQDELDAVIDGEVGVSVFLK